MLCGYTKQYCCCFLFLLFLPLFCLSLGDKVSSLGFSSGPLLPFSSSFIASPNSLPPVLFRKGRRRPGQGGEIRGGSTQSKLVALKMSTTGFDDDEEDEDFSIKTRLREEAESPFRNLRFFVYTASGASATVGALTAVTGSLASWSGVRGALPLDEALKNLAIDVGAIVVSAVLFRLEQRAQMGKLNRMNVGATIAGLRVQLQEEDDKSTLSLADFRRNRGKPRRIIILAGNKEVVQKGLSRALDFKQRLLFNSFLIVPIILSGQGQQATAEQDSFSLADAINETHVALPMGVSEWRDYVAIESNSAQRQGIDAYEQGISILLKLNGKVGQRSFGEPAWEQVVGDVEKRRIKGLDVTNL